MAKPKKHAKRVVAKRRKVPPADAKRLQAVPLLAMGIPHSEICEKLSISRTTLWEWRQDAKFKEAVDAETIEFTRETRELVRSLRDDALKTFRKVLRSKNHAAAVRAAIEVLRSLGTLREPERHMDAAIKRYVVKFANLPGAKDE